MMTDAMLTTFDAYVHAILATLESTYGTRIVEYRPYDLSAILSEPPAIKTPSIYLQIEWQSSDAQIASKVTMGRMATRVSCAIHLMMSTKTPQLQIAIEVFANSILSLLFQPDPDYRGGRVIGQRWGLGLGVDPVEGATVQAGDWQPGLNGFDSRIVSFNQTIYTPANPLMGLNE